MNSEQQIVNNTNSGAQESRVHITHYSPFTNARRRYLVDDEELESPTLRTSSGCSTS